ncbi:MAG: acid phosphatase type 7 [Acidobacteriota bacterium]|nr:acid phosphatase type 7 [Acidobacteriota bacterium]
MRCRCALAFLLLVAGALPVFPLTIVRGPYLQRTATDSVVLRWRTDVASNTWAGWGAVAGAYDQATSSAALVTDHRVGISGLMAKSLYFYAVGTTQEVLAGGDPAHRFRTVAVAGDPDALHLWVIGDCGATSLPSCGGPASGNAGLVRDGYALWAGNATPDLWLLLGDNAYCSGSDAEYQAAVFEVYPRELATVAPWPVFGNHEGVSSDAQSQTGPYFEMFSLPRNAEAGGVASSTEAYFAYESGDLHVVQLDSAESALAPGSPMLTWLAIDLAANTRPWTIVAFHHPPYTKGTHDSDDPADSGGILQRMRQNVVPILEAHGVDLVLAGHSHGYERSFLIDGHYGTTDTFAPATMLRHGGDGDPGGDGAYTKTPGPHQGTVYVVAGNGSRAEGAIAPWPALAVGLGELGSLAIELAGDRMDVRMIRPDATVADHFRIVHFAPLFADGFESGDSSHWSQP